MSLFLNYLVRIFFSPSSSSQFDDLLVEWKNEDRVSKAHFDTCIAALEYVLPQLRSHLPWSHAVSHSWAVVYVPEHKVPLGELPAVYIAAHLAARRHPRLGAGLVLQQALGLRPSELLSIICSDVTLPEFYGTQLHRSAVIGLGVRTGTKAKRAQAVLLGGAKRIALLRWLLAGRGPDELLIGYTYEQFRRVLAATTEAMGLSFMKFTPHSARAGFASDIIAAGEPFSRVKELGRWASDQSCRTYIDVNAATSILVNFKLKKLAEPMAFAVAHMLEFFDGAASFLRLEDSRHAGSGLADGPQPGSVHAAVDSAVDCGAFIAVSEAGGESAAQRHATACAVGQGAGRGRGVRRPGRGARTRASACP